MAAFVPGVDTSVQSEEPSLDVQASAARSLAAGRHVFQLVVTDNAGNVSNPAQIAIVVKERSKPTAEIDFVRDDGTRVYDDAIVVPFGKPFRLTGERSSDASGSVKTWRWTLLTT
jgi:hypothetical protein